MFWSLNYYFDIKLFLNQILVKICVHNIFHGFLLYIY